MAWGAYALGACFARCCETSLARRRLVGTATAVAYAALQLPQSDKHKARVRFCAGTRESFARVRSAAYT
jgi:hypothetical protein